MKITDRSDLWWKTAVVYCLDVETYMDWNDDGSGDFEGLANRLDHLAELGLRAKVRCGGASVPSGDALAMFVRACRERRLVFKATAGLHRAVRSNGDHGFLNLLAAVVFDGEEEAALAETDASAFTLDAWAFVWRDRSASAGELARVRHELLHSIGSCSFFEPVGELEALGMLPR